MKRFLLTATFIFTLVVATLGFGEYLVRRAPNPYKIKHAWMCQNADRTETLFLGSSHSYYGVRPEYIPNSFNIANSSQNLKYDNFMIEQYGERCKQLKNIVLPISYFTLFSRGFENTDNWWLANNYAIYMDCDYHSVFSKYKWEIAHFSVYQGKLKNIIKGKGESKAMCNDLGWGLNYNAVGKSPAWDDATPAITRHTAKDFSFLEENLEYFHGIATWCQEHSVSLILVTTPTWHTYYNHLNQEQLDTMYSVIRNLQEKYSLPYFDYLKDTRFVAEDFYDADHLSNLGATKFTQILWDDINNIG